MKLAWMTDVHLNFIDITARQNFYQEIINSECNAVLISGDIAEAPSLSDILTEMANYISKPIYFVLGNHDYYRGQIDDVRKLIAKLTKENNNLFWLPAAGMQKLDNNSVLVGQDGWADGRLGDYLNSRVALNDSRMITDLFQEKILGSQKLLCKMQKLADKDASELQKDLKRAIDSNPKKIIVLTHVPPFREACLHQGKISDDNWLPYFSSKATGDVLIEIAQKNPSIDFFVFCGHTHSKSKYQPAINLTVEAGKAEYYQPEIQKLITTYRHSTDSAIFPSPHSNLGEQCCK